jgi:hypothetical protein
MGTADETALGVDRIEVVIVKISGFISELP